MPEDCSVGTFGLIKPAFPDEERDTLLSDEQYKQLIRSLGMSREGRGFTRGEAAVVATWAENTIFEKTVLDLVLEGEIFVDVDEDGEILFRARQRVLKHGE